MSLFKVQDYPVLRSILFPKIIDKPASYNADVLITYAALKRLLECDSYHNDEKNLFELFGYKPADSNEFSSEFYQYI